MRILIILSCIFLFSGCKPTTAHKEQLKVDNVIFITIDTLRRDRVSLYGYPFETSPFLTKLSENGVVFDDAITASSQTAPSHTTMFTGLYPSNHGVVKNGLKLSSDKFSIFNLLQANGIKGQAFTATKFLNGATGFPADTTFVYKSRVQSDTYVKGDPKGSSQYADTMLKRAKDWLTTVHTEERFFLWLHLFDVHNWYFLRRLPKRYQDQIAQKPDPQKMSYWIEQQKIDPKLFPSEELMFQQLSSYDLGLSYVDDTISDLFRFVSEKNFSGNTLWVILSDHGEGLGNHNYLLHEKNLYQEQLRIPLLFYIAGEKQFQKRRIKTPVSTVDLLTTLADLLDLKLPDNYRSDGRSFYTLFVDDKPLAANDVRFSQRRPKDGGKRKGWPSKNKYAIQNNRFKYIYSSSTSEKDEFYDLKKDPFELHNILKDGDPKQAELKQKISDIYTSFETSPDREQEVVAPEIVKELQSLGYM